MSRTISKLILRALDNLSDDNMDTFCFHLRNRSDKSKIGRRQVDEKNPVKITDLLISKFTNAGALKVVLETLRLSDCNQEAETLELSANIEQEEEADHQREGEPSVSQMTAQKVSEEVRARERSLPPGQEGEALVGFGRHQTETLKDLYESKDQDRISYVNWLLRKRSYHPGSKMDAAITYILKRDQEQGAAATTRKRRRNRNQYPSSSRPKVKRT